MNTFSTKPTIKGYYKETLLRKTRIKKSMFEILIDRPEFAHIKRIFKGRKRVYLNVTNEDIKNLKGLHKIKMLRSRRKRYGQERICNSTFGYVETNA